LPPETAFFSKSFVLRHFSLVQESEAREPHLTQILSSDLNRFCRNESSAELEKASVSRSGPGGAAHHDQLAKAIVAAQRWNRVIPEYRGHRRQVAGVLIDNSRARGDSGFVRGDAIEVTHCLIHWIADPFAAANAGGIAGGR
jgi:hypothetical protein